MKFVKTLSSFVVVLVLLVTATASAQKDTPPGKRGVGVHEGERLELPYESEDNDQDGAFARETIEEDKEEQGYWHDIYLHNNSGRGDPGVYNGAWVHWIVFTTLAHSDATLTRNSKRDGIHVRRIRRRSSSGKWADWQNVNKIGEEVVVVSDDPFTYGEVLRVQFAVVQDETVESGDSGEGRRRFQWAETWRAVAGNRGTYSAKLLNGNQDEVVSNGGGSDPATDQNSVISVPAKSGDEDEHGNMDYMFDDLSPAMDLKATSIGEDPGTFDAPDLIFSERNSWRIPVGTLRFIATGGANFNEQSDLQVIARDETGEDAVVALDVAFGTPSVVDGVIEVPVVYRNPDAEERIAVMVRGAEVDAPSLATGTIIRYAFGGVSAGPRPVRMPSLLKAGAEPENSVFRTSAEIEVEHIHPSDPQNPGVMDRRVGWHTWMARPYDTSVQEGFIDAIVLGEPESGHIREGSFEITPVDSFEFVESEDTKLFVVNANDHSELVDAFEDGTIEVTTEGALRVTLDQRIILDQPLKLVILNPKLNLGPGPFTADQSARVAIGGDALRGGLQETVRLVELDHGTETDNAFLPIEGHTATELTPLAEVETE